MHDTPDHRMPDPKAKPTDSTDVESTDVGNSDSGAKEPETAPLSPEEQLALYEKDLKENDWGHQPC